MGDEIFVFAKGPMQVFRKEAKSEGAGFEVIHCPFKIVIVIGFEFNQAAGSHHRKQVD